MSIRFLSNANFQRTIICSPKNWMNWDMQPAGWVIYRKPVGKRKKKTPQSERTSLYQGLKCILLAADLHFSMHAAVDVGDAPRWASGSISCRRKHGPLVLVESFQWRVLAWTLQLVPVAQAAVSHYCLKQGKKKILKIQNAHSHMWNDSLHSYSGAFLVPKRQCGIERWRRYDRNAA